MLLLVYCHIKGTVPVTIGCCSVPFIWETVVVSVSNETFVSMSVILIINEADFEGIRSDHIRLNNRDPVTPVCNIGNCTAWKNHRYNLKATHFKN